MKRLSMLCLIFCVMLNASLYNCYALSIERPRPAKSRDLPLLKIGKLVRLSPYQFAELTGKKMNLWDRISFDLLKIKMKHDLKKDPNLTLKDFYGSKRKKRLGTGWIILIIVGSILLLLTLYGAAVSKGLQGLTTP